MRIALVVHDYHQHGGHSRYVAELARRFAGQHEVHVFANRIESDKESGIHFHRVPAWRASALSTVLSFPVPASIAVGGSFDIVHAQGFSTLRCNVMTAHICNQAWHEARRQLGNLTWKDHVFDGIVGACEKAAVSGPGSPWVIAISERIRGDLAAHCGRTDRISVIPHAVSTERFAPPNQKELRQEIRRRLGIPDATPAFLFVGDLRKGAEAAMECIRDVPEAHLICVSRTAPEPYRETGNRWGMSERLHLCTATAAIEEYYAAADVFLFPTPYDAFGMVITEAMAAGLPVITTRAAGAAQWIEPGASGFLVDHPGQIQELTAFARRLAADPAERLSMGQRGQDAVRTWTWDCVADSTLEVYRQVLNHAA